MSLELTLAFSEVAKAEIRWALDSALKRNSNSHNANISTPMKLCFQNAELLSCFL